MNASASIVMSCVAMVGLVTAVSLRMVLVRIAEMKQRRIHPQQIASSRQIAEQLQDTRASDNYRNLFELPVLFYALCGALLLTANATTVFIVGAWLFVLLRIVHSLIQCTYNKVLHRFYVFLASSGLLLALWIGLGIRILSA